MKRCNIYLDADEYIITTVSTATTGIGITTSPFFHVPKTESLDIVVKNIFTAFEANKKNVPHPKDFSKSEREYLDNMGFRTLTELHNNIKCSVGAENDGWQIHFHPMRNEKSKRRFIGVSKEKTVTISVEEPSNKIFEALMQAFENCE